MARKPRVEYPGAVYHVVNRGDRRELILKEDADRQWFGATLGEETFRKALLAQMSKRLGAEPCGEERAETAAARTARLGMGSRGCLNHLLYRRRKTGAE